MWFIIFLTVLTYGFLSADQRQAGAADDMWADAITVPLNNSEAKQVGAAKLLQTPQGALIKLQLSQLPAGTHAFHIHEVGKCDPPDFTSAGGHFNPSNHKHGLLAQDGRHAGDLPNIHVPESGTLTVEMLASQVSMKEGPRELFDENGSALVIHSGVDDYRTDPAGDAGSRIACGVISKPPQKQ